MSEGIDKALINEAIDLLVKGGADLKTMFAKDGSGKKDVLPLAWAHDQITGRQYWRSKRLNEDNGKPIYRAEQLQNKSRTVLIVEGEKAADSAAKLLPTLVLFKRVFEWAGEYRLTGKVVLI